MTGQEVMKLTEKLKEKGMGRDEILEIIEYAETHEPKEGSETAYTRVIPARKSVRSRRQDVTLFFLFGPEGWQIGGLAGLQMGDRCQLR